MSISVMSAHSGFLFMIRHCYIVAFACVVFIQLATANPISPRQAPPGHNNFGCRSSKHPNPVILLHGMLACEYDDLNLLEAFLIQQEFCTFGTTYGEYSLFPFAGGLKEIADSAGDVAAFINEVKSRTGAAKVDLVGHSEGGFQSFYVSKFEGIAPIVDKIVAIAPPTHGSTLGNIYNVVAAGGSISVDFAKMILNTIGCEACNDLVPIGDAVTRLNDGKPIVQQGNNVLVIASKHDEVVTPPETAFIHENGVKNVFVQDGCPNDPVGHAGLALDQNVWYQVLNHLDPSFAIPQTCYTGISA